MADIQKTVSGGSLPFDDAQGDKALGGLARGTGDGIQMPPMPVIPADGQEVFDEIMGRIEPDLTSKERPGPNEKYKDETPEQKAARMERYGKAFEEYDRQYAERRLKSESGLRQYQSSLLKSVEAIGTADEQSTLGSLESAIALEDQPKNS